MKAVFTLGECWKCITRLENVRTRSMDYRVAEVTQILPVEQRLRLWATCETGKKITPGGSSRNQAGSIEQYLPCQLFHDRCIAACNLDDTELLGQSRAGRKTNTNVLVGNNYGEHLW